MLTALYIGLAGALGSVCRYLIGAGMERWSAGRFPLGTLTVNVLGSFLIGAVMVLFAARGELDSRARLALTVGFMGGFTTYSAFAFETMALVEKRSFGLAATYASVTLVGAGIACYAGMLTARALD